MVMSADGKITRGDKGPNLWASPEDQARFEHLKKKIGVLIMGRKTYEAALRQAQGKLPGGIERIVMSHGGPTPREVVAGLEKRGIHKALLVGGSELNAAFFKEKLVSEIYLTIEPKIFGEGLPLAQGVPLDVQLELLDVKQLNQQGTLLLHYRVK